MITKLTLTIEKSVIEKAKKYRYNRKLSKSNYWDEVGEDIEVTPLVKSLKGSFKASEDFWLQSWTY